MIDNNIYASLQYKEIKQYCIDYCDLEYDELYQRVEEKLNRLRQFVRENNLSFDIENTGMFIFENTLEEDTL